MAAPERVIIAGRKGGKGGGGGHVPTEAPNTLRSRSVARIVDLIGEGEIAGLINGAQSIYFDDTPLQAKNGRFNFSGVTVTERVGTSDQAHMPGFPMVEEEIPVGAQVTNAAPVIRSLSARDLDAVRVKIRIPSLFQVEDDGDIVESSVSLAIQYRIDGAGAWIDAPVSFAWETFGAPFDFSNGVAVPQNSAASSGTGAVRLEATVNRVFPKESAITGLPGTTQTRTLSVDWVAQYRAVGAGTWITFGIFSQDRKQLGIPRFDNTGALAGTVIGLTDWSPLTVSRTFISPELAEGDYEIRVVGTHTSLSRRALKSVAIEIAGKTTSPYERQYRIDLPGTATDSYDIRVVRNTADAEDSRTANDTFWSSYTRITDAKLIYPDSAVLGLTVDAEQFGDRVPARSYDVKGRIIRVPSNYEPETRVYSGIWDGTFKTAWSDNPAWVLYDLLTSARFGLGEFINESQIDKFALFEIAQYCDQLVPDGFGAQEPRFTFNGVINSQEDAYTVLQSFASVFRGMVYWGTGSVTAVQDAPADPLKLVSPANVIDGDFQYSGTALKARHTVALVAWNDFEDGSRPAIEMVEDPAALDKYGFRPVDVTAFATSSRGQAHRLGRWILESEQNETETVTYRAGLDHADVRPGDIIKVADPSVAGVRFGGRIVSATTSALTLDDTVTLEAGETYTISVVLADGSLADGTISDSAGDHTTVNLAEALAEAPAANAMWVITASNVAPRLFRVLANSEIDGDAHIFEVTALSHDPNKFARVEQDARFDPPVFTRLTGDLDPPTDVTITEYLFQEGTLALAAVTVSWRQSPDPRVLFYSVEAKRPGHAEFQIIADTTQSLSVDIKDAEAGAWSFRVRGTDGIGRRTDFARLDSYLIMGTTARPANVTGFATNILGDSAHLQWTSVGDLDLDHYQIRFSTATSGATWHGAAVLVDRVAKDATGISVPAMVGTYLVKAVDQTGNESENAALLVSTIQTIASMNAVATVTESPTFAGTHGNTRVFEGGLQLAQADTVDDWPDVDAVTNWDMGNAGLDASGTYTFADPFDLGAVYTSRLTSEITVDGVNLTDNIDDWPDVDAVTNWDGTTPDQWNAELQVRTTGDDPAGTPTWSAWQTFTVGDYTARAFEFRIVLHSLEFGVSPKVTSLVVQIDMPDRIAAEDDVTVPAAGLNVTFSPAFRAKPAIGITGQDMQTGDYFTVTNISRTGFTFRFFNSAGAGIERTADWIAKGYGVET